MAAGGQNNPVGCPVKLPHAALSLSLDGVVICAANDNLLIVPNPQHHESFTHLLPFKTPSSLKHHQLPGQVAITSTPPSVPSTARKQPPATMSWAGFKKSVNRTTTQVLMKTGQVEKTNDRDYEVEERRYRTMEAAATRLQKEARGYLDSLRSMTRSQMAIAETIDAFYGEWKIPGWRKEGGGGWGEEMAK